MEREVLHACSSIDAVFSLLGKRWNGQIIDVMFQRPVTFTELVDAIPGLSHRMLSQRLRELQECRVVEKVQEDSRIEYRLTEAGARLEPAFHSLRRWAHDQIQEGAHSHP